VYYRPSIISVSVHLYPQVLSSREKSEIGQESSSYRQNELLLSALCYKPEDSYDKFLTALDKTDQGHVRNALTGRTGMTLYIVHFSVKQNGHRGAQRQN